MQTITALSVQQINSALFSLEQSITSDQEYKKDETDTGKIFIDGKHIYRKSFHIEEDWATSTSQITKTIGEINSSFSSVVNLYGCFKTTNENWVPIGCAHPTTTNYQTECWVEGDGTVKFSYANRDIFAIVVTVEYIKQ